MLWSSPDANQPVRQLPGPDAVLIFLWRKLCSGGDYLLYRYSNTYRRHLAMKRLLEFS